VQPAASSLMFLRPAESKRLDSTAVMHSRPTQLGPKNARAPRSTTTLKLPGLNKVELNYKLHSQGVSTFIVVCLAFTKRKKTFFDRSEICRNSRCHKANDRQYSTSAFVDTHKF